MDIGLPGMDGLTFTRLLKADNATSGIKIVALTAFAMKGDEQKVIEAGCDGYIPKPIDTRTLAGQVQACLGEHSVL
jgi:CheY-like chemotaxis protein